jgi:hypothetical protein
MQLLGDLSDFLKKPGLDVHVDIFQAMIELKFAPLDLPFDGTKPFDQLDGLFMRNDADMRQHSAMGNAAIDIMGIQPPVHIDR